MQRPTTIAIAAVTVDGKIARNNHEFASWTSKEDKKVFVRESKKAGVIIVGRRTFDTFPGPLPGRLNVVMEKSTEGLNSIPGSVEYTSKQPQELLEDLGARGFTRVVIAGGSFIYSLFAQSHLLDELLVTVEPKVFGEGINLFAKQHELDLELLSVEQINTNSVLLHYKNISSNI